MLIPLSPLLITLTLALVTAQAIVPSAIYTGGHGNTSVQLNIGNGGAGQSGLIGALANAFINHSVSTGSEPFSVAWYTSDTTYSIKNLETGLLDIAVTYSPAAEAIAIAQGIALSPSYHAFRDHFLVVGPPSNPANLNMTSDVLTMFSDMRAAADAAVGNSTLPPVRFLSRFDKSATNIKEALLWTQIGQVPWATAYSTWYHQYIAFPIQALTAAITLGEYTLTDRGTLLSLSPDLAAKTTVYKAGSDDASDPLLNPAHILVGARAPNPPRAAAFAAWVVAADGGQEVITAFVKEGQVLYSPAPAASADSAT